VNYDLAGIDLGLAYVGVDKRGKDAFKEFGVNKVVFSVAKSF